MKRKLLVITATMVMMVVLSGCGPKIPTPTETTDSFLQALKSQDAEAIASVYDGTDVDLLEAASDSAEDNETDSDSETTDTGLEAVYEEQMLPKMLDFDYELSNEQIDGDKATVDVKITTYRIGDAFTAFFSDYISQAFMLAFSDASEEDLDALATTILAGKLADLSEKTYEKTATLSLSMKDDKWVVDNIEVSDEFLDAITGGLVTSMKTMTDAFSAWGEEE